MSLKESTDRAGVRLEFYSCRARIGGLSVCICVCLVIGGGGGRGARATRVLIRRRIRRQVGVASASQPLVVVAHRVRVRERVEREQRARARQQTLPGVIARARLVQALEVHEPHALVRTHSALQAVQATVKEHSLHFTSRVSYTLISYYEYRNLLLLRVNQSDDSCCKPQG